MKMEEVPDAPVKTETAAEPVSDMPEVVKNKASKPPKGKKGEGGGSFKENPYTFLPPDDPAIATCVYGPVHPFLSSP
jgi:multisite-specific tRNA:(cytosine-C5)-methyltransferase